MAKSKIETYLGFCIRSGKIVFGTDNIEKERKGIYLLLVDLEIGKNSLKIMERAKEKFACPLLQAESLGERLYRPSVKAVAIKDKNLASAILSVVESEPQFKLYSGGCN